MRERMVWVCAVLGCLAGCGGDCGGSSFFGGSANSASVALPSVAARVRVDGATVVIEVTRTSYGGACSPGATETLRFVWDAAAGRANPSTMVPSSAARTVVGVQLGGGVTTYENVIPGLTIRVSGEGTFGGPITFTFESGTVTSTLTCNASGALSCG